jgi:hypothetical protein
MNYRHAGKFGLADFAMILAVLLFFLASLGKVWSPDPWPWNGRLIAAGLFFWSLSTVL